MGNIYNRVYIWCCKYMYSENRYCERCANKKWCASKHTGLLNSCLGKLCLHPYLVVPLISARVTLISTRVSVHCQAILLSMHVLWIKRDLSWQGDGKIAKQSYSLGGDLMRERTRSRIQYGGRQMRRVNKGLFLPFYQRFANTIYAMRWCWSNWVWCGSELPE